MQPEKRQTASRIASDYANLEAAHMMLCFAFTMTLAL
jgi:hypothetical protein